MQADQINLEIVARNDNFNNWMYGEIKSYVRGDILEVGSGLGTFSSKLIKDFAGSKIYLSDINAGYLARLQDFGKEAQVAVVKLDLNKEKDFAALGGVKFDTIICLNVLEHIQDDELALREMKRLLKSGGRLILLAPGHQWLYNKLDKAVLHFRCYRKRELEQKAAQAGFALERAFYFNFFAIFGWFWEGNILQRRRHSYKLFWVFNKLAPLFKFIEKYILQRSVGISIIAICRVGNR